MSNGNSAGANDTRIVSMICPHCKCTLLEAEIVALNSALRGSRRSPAKAAAAARNGKLGGRKKKERE